MAKKTRPNVIALALSNQEYEEARQRANELEISIQEFLRNQIYGDNDQQLLIKTLVRLERVMTGLRQDFRAVYFPDI